MTSENNKGEFAAKSSGFKHYLIKLVNYTYETIVMIYLLTFYHQLFNDLTLKRLSNFRMRNSKATFAFIFESCGYMVIFEELVIKFATLKNGRRIYQSIIDINKYDIDDNDLLNDSLEYRRQYYHIFLSIFIQLIVNIYSFQIVSHSTSKDLRGHLHYLFGSLIFTANKFTFTIIFSIVSISINRHIAVWRYNFYKDQNYSQLLLKLFEQYNNLKILNGYLSLTIFVKIFSLSLRLSVMICLIEDNYSNDHDIRLLIVYILLFLSAFFELYSYCSRSQSVNDNLNNFIESIQWLNANRMINNNNNNQRLSIITESFNNVDDHKKINPISIINHKHKNEYLDRWYSYQNDYRCFEEIKRLNDKFYFKAMDMIVMKNSLLLTIIGNVFSFTILLIQTR